MKKIISETVLLFSHFSLIYQKNIRRKYLQRKQPLLECGDRHKKSSFVSIIYKSPENLQKSKSPRVHYLFASFDVICPAISSRLLTNYSDTRFTRFQSKILLTKNGKLQRKLLFYTVDQKIYLSRFSVYMFSLFRNAETLLCYVFAAFKHSANSNSDRSIRRVSLLKVMKKLAYWVCMYIIVLMLLLYTTLLTFSSRYSLSLVEIGVKSQITCLLCGCFCVG